MQGVKQKLLSLVRHYSSVQFWKYFIVASLGLVVDFGTLILLKQVGGINYLLAAAGGFLAGLVVNYILSELFVFKDPKIQSKSINFALFAIIGLIGLGILSLFMWALTDGLHINYVISKVIATIFVYAWNYSARKKLYHN